MQYYYIKKLIEKKNFIIIWISSLKMLVNNIIKILSI